MDFILLLLVNLMLFLRPAEIVPDLEGLPIYNWLILAAFAVSLPRIIGHLHPAQLVREPVTVCVLGMLPAVVVSHLSRFDTFGARINGFEFLKVVIYYLVLISTVNSTHRIRVFLYAVAIMTAANAAIAVLHYYEYIHIPALSVYQQNVIDAVTGEQSVVPRLCATGIFNDPNDLAMISVLAFVIAVLGLGDKRLGTARFFWLAPALLMLTTIGLTKSRGGVLALGASLFLLAYLRYGIWKAGVIACLFLPLAAVLVAGRETSFEGSTAHSRVELWSCGLQSFKSAPFFGIGMHNYVEECGQAAHNSFLHCLTELGLFGGGLFLGAWWYGGRSLWSLYRQSQDVFGRIIDPVLAHLVPYELALVGGVCTSMFSLTRSYTVSTYLALGTVTAISVQSQREGLPAVVRWRSGSPMRLLLLSIAFLIGVYLFIRLSIR